MECSLQELLHTGTCVCVAVIDTFRRNLSGASHTYAPNKERSWSARSLKVSGSLMQDGSAQPQHFFTRPKH